MEAKLKSKADELIIGISESICKLRELIVRIADIDASVLISGESGTGKTLAAMAIHQISKRRNERLLQFDCAVASEKSLEIELFGVAKSSFADEIKGGLLGYANKCNVLFKNIDCLPIRLQVNLLHILQEKKIKRSNSHVCLEADIRFIVTTQRDLTEKIKANLFREDLFFRLNVIPIQMPSLRDRQNDIEPLLYEFASRMIKDSGVFLADIHKYNLLPYLQQYSWPGNVRELRKIVERLILDKDWETIKNWLSTQTLDVTNMKMKQSDHKKPSVFLSYCRQDKRFARKLSSDLELFGVKVWIDEVEIKIGDSLIEKIRQGIDQVDYFAVVLSPSSVNSEWVKKEVDIATNQEIEGRKVKVLPLLLSDCEIPWFLKGKLYANFTTDDLYKQSLSELLQRLQLGQ